MAAAVADAEACISSISASDFSHLHVDVTTGDQVYIHADSQADTAPCTPFRTSSADQAPVCMHAHFTLMTCGLMLKQG